VEDLEGRPDDMIGLVTFAGYPDSKCPLTLDHSFLVSTLEQSQIVSPETAAEEDGTAIGEALALAVERLSDLDRRREVAKVNRVKNKIIVLLTDGENNRGDIAPEKAAEMAKAMGITIYTIGAGTDGWAPMSQVDVIGRRRMGRVRVSIDEDTLRDIAKITGGRYWRATDTESLKEVYAEINELEKTETEEKRYLQYKELATEGLRLGGFDIPPLLVIAMVLLILEVVLVNTRLRKIP
jgi:Ca-activated chloride channel homolog